MERIVNGERIQLHERSKDEIIDNMASVLLNTVEPSCWIWGKFQSNIKDAVTHYPELQDFLSYMVDAINQEWQYEFATLSNFAIIHDQILNLWKHYKRLHPHYMNSEGT